MWSRCPLLGRRQSRVELSQPAQRAQAGGEAVLAATGDDEGGHVRQPPADRRPGDGEGARAVVRTDLPLISAGGIASADDAWERITAGATLVQLYSALVYEGPGLARRIAAGLAERLKREGMTSISEAVGLAAR